MASLIAQISSLLLVSNRPVSTRQIAQLTEVNEETVRDTLLQLSALYQNEDLGMKIIRIGDEFQLVSDPDAYDVVEKFLKAELFGELTRPQLETLTIIAYRGPVSKAEIEMVRGVHSGIVLRNLLMRGLIIENGSTGEAGMTEYRISAEALKLMGLASVEELPEYPELSTNEVLASALSRAAAMPDSDQPKKHV